MYRGPTRRGIIGGLLAAPAIIKLAPLMKISPSPLLTPIEQVRQEYQSLLDDGLVEDNFAQFLAMDFVRRIRPFIQSTFPREALIG